MVLDAASLEAITQEIRTCFLYEDAPDHLSILDAGIRQLRATDPTTGESSEYTALMRAAHSLKGGAGIAQFLTLSRLAHKLEDLLLALQQKRVPEPNCAFELLSVSVEQITTLIAAATSTHTEAFDHVAAQTTLLPTLTEIESFLQNLPLAEEFHVVGANAHTRTQEGQGNALPLQKVSTEQGSQKGAGVPPQGQTGVDQAEKNLSPPDSPPTPQDTADQLVRNLNLRIPVSRLDQINNTIGELFISYERLSLYQEQLGRVDRTLKQRAARLNPLSEEVQAIYDNLAITPAVNTSTTSEPRLSSSDRLQSSSCADATKIHSTLQDLQELIVQVQEVRSDVELLNDEFREALVQLRHQLDDLRSDVTEALLVQFGLLAGQFVAAQQSFSQRYNKSVELVIVGKETLIDRVILEQLKIPLLHLFRNAFAHGIETPEERLAQGKSPIAQITLGASIVGNHIRVTLADDGRGIDIQAIHQRAIELGLCDDQSPDITPPQILELLFHPGFSTATKVTSFSGRGLGLDIVRLQVERLRGKVAIQTNQGQGTTFTLTMPLTLNILPLLLCKCQQQTLAIPAPKVKEVIALSDEGKALTHDSRIEWRDRTAMLYSLIHLLPYRQRGIIPPLVQLNCSMGVVLEVDEMVIVLAVNSVLGERELLLKPFDPTVKVPAYILGGAVLGTGEVVPVLSPEHFGSLLTHVVGGEQTSKTSVLASEWKAHILIVDDAIAFRRILERILTHAGYQVVQCRDGKEAWELLSSPTEQFDLVISDIEMPQMDGFELLKEIRHSPRWHNLPVMILTSRENPQHRQTASNLGATDYFTKPFQADELLSAIALLIPQVAV